MERDERNDIATIGGREVFLVRIPKCATHSMATALGLRVPGYHVSLPRLVAMYGEERVAAGAVLACVRNPYDRLVSWHEFHAEKDPGLYYGHGVAAFRAWVTDGCPNRFAAVYPSMHLWEQGRWIDEGLDRRYILLYERLEEDWELMVDELGLPAELPHVNRSRRLPWEEYYDKRTARRATTLVWNDLQPFGYPVHEGV